MQQSNYSPLAKRLIARSFSRAARGYDQHAALQQEVGKRLLQRLEYTKINPARILDLGSGTGYFSQELARIFPNAEIVSVDIAEGMLQYAKLFTSTNQAQAKTTQQTQQLCCADAEALPFAKLSFDLIFSNLMLQWLPAFNRTFTELHYLLKPNGLLLFTTLGADTLKELRSAWQQVDSHPHVNTFTDLHLVGDELLTTHFVDPVVDMENITLTYPSVLALLRELKLTGANTLPTKQQKHCLAKSSYYGMTAAYEQKYQANDTIPATFEVIYGQAWGAELLQRQTKDEFGKVYISLDAISYPKNATEVHAE